MSCEAPPGPFAAPRNNAEPFNWCTENPAPLLPPILINPFATWEEYVPAGTPTNHILLILQDFPHYASYCHNIYFPQLLKNKKKWCHVEWNRIWIFI